MPCPLLGVFGYIHAVNFSLLGVVVPLDDTLVVVVAHYIIGRIGGTGGSSKTNYVLGLDAVR